MPVRAYDVHNPERLPLVRLHLAGGGGRKCITIRHTSHGRSTNSTNLLRTRLVQVMGPGDSLPYVTGAVETSLAPQG
jgi:hypothetical protein